MSKWNNAKDSTSTPGVTKKAPYQFQSTSSASSADVVVIFDPNLQGTGQYQSGFNPPRIVINPNWPGWTSQNLAAVIAHELGHNRGLGNAYNPSSGCDGADSIMNNNSQYLEVRDRDVYQMNKNYNNSTRGQCCADATNDPGSNMTTGGTGGGGGTTSPSSCPAFCPGSTNGPYYTAGPADYCKYPGTGCPFGQFYYGGGCVWNCPILIDGDGFDLTDAAGGVYYDPAGDGRYGYTAWPAPGSDDAWLALDRDDNGRIDSFKELFGNITEQPASDDVNGFAALAAYDAAGRGGNGDGQIDGLDAIFRSLRLWQDTNHNGVSEPEELHTLPSLNVHSVSLDYKESGRTDAYGNVFRYRAKVYGPNRQQLGRWAYDVFPVAQP